MYSDWITKLINDGVTSGIQICNDTGIPFANLWRACQYVKSKRAAGRILDDIISVTKGTHKRERLQTLRKMCTLNMREQLLLRLRWTVKPGVRPLVCEIYEVAKSEWKKINRPVPQREVQKVSKIIKLYRKEEYLVELKKDKYRLYVSHEGWYLVSEWMEDAELVAELQQKQPQSFHVGEVRDEQYTPTRLIPIIVGEKEPVETKRRIKAKHILPHI